MSRIFTVSFASVYPHYVTKVEKKGRTKAELDQVIEWLTGLDESALSKHLAAGRQDLAGVTVDPPVLADASLRIRRFARSNSHETAQTNSPRFLLR
jgi:hypothetical protein